MSSLPPTTPPDRRPQGPPPVQLPGPRRPATATAQAPAPRPAESAPAVPFPEARPRPQPRPPAAPSGSRRGSAGPVAKADAGAGPGDEAPAVGRLVAVPVLAVVGAMLWANGLGEAWDAIQAATGILVVCALVGWVAFVLAQRSRRAGEMAFAAAAVLFSAVVLLRTGSGAAMKRAAKEQEDTTRTIAATLESELSRYRTEREKAWRDFDQQEDRARGSRATPASIATRIDGARRLGQVCSRSCEQVALLPQRIVSVVHDLAVPAEARVALQIRLSEEVYQPLTRTCAAELELSGAIVDSLEMLRSVVTMASGEEYVDVAKLQEAYDASVERVRSCSERLETVQKEEEVRRKAREHLEKNAEHGEKGKDGGSAW